MSQESLQPPVARPEAITYGDVFNIQGELASKPVAPGDAAMMQALENAMLGGTKKGGVAAHMQAAASWNEKAGLVGHNDMNYIPTIQADAQTAADASTVLSGRSNSPRSSPRQDLGQNHKEDDQKAIRGAITIGEALEAASLTAGEKAVEWSDAAAIQAAEVRATGRATVVPGGVAAAAQSAATYNAKAAAGEDKKTLADVLTDAASKLPKDKVATRRDAEGVSGAEMRNDPYLTTHPAGVSASIVAAARLNQKID